MPKSKDDILHQVATDRDTVIYYLGRMHGGLDTVTAGASPASDVNPPAAPSNRRPPPKPQNERPRGGIQKAVLEVMRRASRPLSVADIHAGALGYVGDIQREQVRQALYRLIENGIVARKGGAYFIIPSEYTRSLAFEDDVG